MTTLAVIGTGMAKDLRVNVGDMIQAGQRLANVVPLNDVFIDANYKETQLKRIRPGQPVNISVDAYGHRKFEVMGSLAIGVMIVLGMLAVPRLRGTGAPYGGAGGG